MFFESICNRFVCALGISHRLHIEVRSRLSGSGDVQVRKMCCWLTGCPVAAPPTCHDCSRLLTIAHEVRLDPVQTAIALPTHHPASYPPVENVRNYFGSSFQAMSHHDAVAMQSGPQGPGHYMSRWKDPSAWLESLALGRPFVCHMGDKAHWRMLVSTMGSR